MKAGLVILFALTLGLLSLRSARLKIADTWLDPIGHVDAQDEAMYAHSAMRMAEGRGWLTPTYQGRFALYKPPLLAWLAAASAKVGTTSAYWLRLPVMLAAALTACLALLWGKQLAAVLLLLSNHVWLVVSSLCLTDGLLAAAVAGAVYCLVLDPRLDRRPTRWGYAALTAAAIMTKSIAGIVPLLILVAYWAITRSYPRVLAVGMLAAALVAPWCAYQMAVHPRWFWNEFVASEILVYGVKSPIQTSQDNAFLFYGKRLLETDPVLLVAFLAALPVLWRKRPAPLIAWLLVCFAIPFLWSYHNLTYLLPLIPAMAIAAGYVLRSRAAIAALVAVFAVKVAFPAEPWGLELRPRPLHASLPLLDGYRGDELILVEPFEGFYSAVLPIPQVRYCFVNPGGVPPQGPLDLHRLGIIVSEDEFERIDELRPRFQAELDAWGLHSAAPIATSIVARDRGGVLRMMGQRPHTDFLLPDTYRPSDPAHVAGPSAGGYFLWLHRN